MPRNGSGLYALPSPPSPLQNGTAANATDVMTILDDLGSALTTSIATDGQTTATSLPLSDGAEKYTLSVVSKNFQIVDNTVGATRFSISAAGVVSLGSSTLTLTGLIVSGTASLADVNASGTLAVTGAATLGGGATVTGAVSATGDISTSGGSLSVTRAGADAVMSLTSSGGSGRTYSFLSATNGVLAIGDVTAGANRLTIDTSGNVTAVTGLFAPTAAPGTNNTQVATTAFVQEATGGVTNPVGSDVAHALVKYGVFSATAGGSGTVTLPSAFPTTLLAVVCTPQSVPGTNNSLAAAPVSAGSFSYNWSSTVGGTHNVQYIAFGY
jgi:hypothetical protein